MTVAACAETTSGAWRDLRLGISPVLVFLLMVLTPIGTGQGVHRDQLMDPVFPHLHFLGNGGRAAGRGSRSTAAPCG